MKTIIKRFSRTIDDPLGQSGTALHRKLDEFEVEILAEFDRWRVDTGAQVLGVQWGREVPRWVEHGCPKIYVSFMCLVPEVEA